MFSRLNRTKADSFSRDARTLSFEYLSFSSKRLQNIDMRPKLVSRNLRSSLGSFASIAKNITPEEKKPSASLSKKESHDWLSPDSALAKHGSLLTVHEREELRDYPQIFYLGLCASKTIVNPKLENKGFSSDGVYKMNLKDHVAYRYEIKEFRGEGTFGQVYAAYDHKNNYNVALKAIKNNFNFFQQSAREVEILSSLQKQYNNSSYSIEILDDLVFRNHRFLVFKLMHKSLRSYIKENKRLALKKVVHVAHQLLYALSQFHFKGIIHADLKPDNIMFTGPECESIRVIDFGNAVYEKRKSVQYIQSRFYRAPEVMLGGGYSSSVDIWSLGCIILEMICGTAPFRGEDTKSQLVSIMEYKGLPPLRLFENSDELLDLNTDSLGKKLGTRHIKDIVGSKNKMMLDLVGKCLEWNPQKRISAIDALAHPLFKRPGTTKSGKTSSLRASSYEK